MAILSDRQQEFLDFIVAFEKKHRKSPTFREIAIGLDVTSKGTVSAIVNILVKEGFLRRREKRIRGLKVRKRAA